MLFILLTHKGCVPHLYNMFNHAEQINIVHPDISAIELTTKIGNIQILNIYNDCWNNTTLNIIATFMWNNPPARSATVQTHYIWLGDFNWHHPIWDEPRNSHLFTKSNLDLAQPLLTLLDIYNMKMALPPFIPTLKAHKTGNHTRMDNVFCSESLLHTFTKCNTDDVACLVKTDHYPIILQMIIL